VLKIINDYGLSVVAIGQEGSQARVACERQKLIDRLADCIYAGEFQLFDFILDKEKFPPHIREYISIKAHEREREMDRGEFAEWAISARETRHKRYGHASL
jgi:hypothetical protein